MASKQSLLIKQLAKYALVALLVTATGIVAWVALRY